MLQKLLSLFKSDADPQLTKIKKLVAEKYNPYAALNEAEQTFLMLRLAQKSEVELCGALSCGPLKLKEIENNVITKLSKK
jgi:hypothetical protein